MRTLFAAICFVSMGAAAAAQTVDRPALLERLLEALPGREAPSRPEESQSAVALRAQLVATHPERASDIDAALVRLSACLDTEGDRLARRFLRTAADAHLSNDEISALVAFYEGPDYPRLDAFIHQTTESPNLVSAEEREWAEQIMTRPELRKFGQLVMEVGRYSPHSREVQGTIRQCSDATIGELRTAGLMD